MSGSSESTLALFEQFRTLGDNDLIRLAQKGNQEAVSFLLNKYKSLVKMKATAYFLVGADKEDLIQEGMIGLYKAILDFRKNKEGSFRVFAEFCIIMQMITAIKTATRQELLPLNTYLSAIPPSQTKADDLADFRQAQEYFAQNKEEIVADYDNKYVAILDNKIVDSDEDFSSTSSTSSSG
ncbi:sigma factor [Candidatus Hakubella thermalkaliphila]|uniref:RNA polymerase sporulation-specific sigma factor n=1 Tax=Candidatus Hakubella thermalkaliphila TaxID=2754717 RepID=A0A6V8Q7Q6_9ACTN|nr:sigma factor [Candidatus Hakubella thermalkaliphila]GFP40637.1 RNA polymerase sporulation-specific sigma factor [Candidatus Hakubella thermalkaliphila]